MPDPFQAAKKSLAAATRGLQRMQDARDFEAYEDGWNALLSELEKVWEKTRAVGKRLSPKFEPWFGQKAAVKKSDPLLQFLHQARNADHHGIGDVDSVEHIPGGIAYRPPGDGDIDIRIDYMLVGPEGLLAYEGSEPIEQRVIPPRIELKRIVNRSVVYETPNEHLGKKLKFTDPVFVAHTGLRWYEQLVRDAEAAFVS